MSAPALLRSACISNGSSAGLGWRQEREHRCWKMSLSCSTDWNERDWIVSGGTFASTCLQCGNMTWRSGHNWQAFVDGTKLLSNDRHFYLTCINKRFFLIACFWNTERLARLLYKDIKNSLRLRKDQGLPVFKACKVLATGFWDWFKSGVISFLNLLTHSGRLPKLISVLPFFCSSFAQDKARLGFQSNVEFQITHFPTHSQLFLLQSLSTGYSQRKNF